MVLIACSSCSAYIRRGESTCPHCGAEHRTEGGALARTAGAVLMGLALAGCPAEDDDVNDSAGSATSDGSATTDSDTNDGSTTAVDPTAVSSGSAYGVPTTESDSDSTSDSGPVETTDDASSSGSTGGSSGSGSGTDGDTDTDGTSTGGGSTTTG